MMQVSALITKALCWWIFKQEVYPPDIVVAPTLILKNKDRSLWEEYILIIMMAQVKHDKRTIAHS